MNNRFLLYIAFTLVLFMIWQQWKIEQAPVVNNTNINNSNIINKEESTLQDFPEEAIMDSNSGNSNNKNQELVEQVKVKTGEELTLSNNDLAITIDTAGGTIKKADLLNYFETTEPNSKNISLLDFDKDYYVAQSGLLHDKSSNRIEKPKLAPNHHGLYIVKSKRNNSLVLEWKNEDSGIKVLKKIYLDEEVYRINIENTVINGSNKAWSGRQYRQIRRKSTGEGRSWVTPTFTGGAYYDGTYNKISYDEIAEKKPKFNVLSGWVAMMEHYFVSAWFFPKEENNLFYT